MLGCNETVTLVQRVEEDGGDRYICTLLCGASWFAKTVVSVDGNGARPVSVLKSRVLEPAVPPEVAPHTGDYLVRGELEAMTGPACLEGHTYFQITAVGDNRRGRIPHWALSGG